MSKALAVAFAFSLAHGGNMPAQRIQPLNNVPAEGIQMAFLATDGSVIGQGNSGNHWYRYVPDINGDYSDGTWSQIASLQNGYAPSAMASDVLADGRLAIIGGEYNGTNSPYPLQLTNLGAIYDPAKNQWTALTHPGGWDYIGDSPSSVLPNGDMLVGNKLTTEAAYLDPSTLKWKKVKTTGKADFNAEEGWTLLPDGSILTEDVKDAPNSERYVPSMHEWFSAGSTIVDLHSPSPYKTCLRYGPKIKDCYLPPGEIGPAILRPDGSVFVTGSGSGLNGGGAGHTAIYQTQGSQAGTWSVGPDFPNDDNAGDSWAALLPSGNVLVFGVTGALYEWNGSTLTQTGTYGGVPLLLPTGQVMIIGSSIGLYTGSGSPQSSWAPTITNSPSSVNPGSTYQISGTQFNGLGQAMSFGDEYQNATNYPLVRITNNNTGHVFYAKTHNHSTMAVATGNATVYTYFDVPTSIETGPSTIEVVANGIASEPSPITVY